MAEKTIKIRFTEPRQVLDHNRKVIQQFAAGEVAELSEASARHWLNRNAANIVGAAGEPEPEPRPDGDALMAAIAAVIQGMDSKEDFTRDGLPKVPVIEDALGYGISADERNAVWQALQTGQPPT